jgi:type IV secretion system protein VirB10
MVQNPNDPFFGNGNDAGGNGDQDEELRTGAPVVSAAPSRVLFVLGGIGAFVVIVMILLFSGKKEDAIEGEKTAQISTNQGQNLPPPLPPVEAPPPPIFTPPPAPPETPPVVDVPILKTDEATEKARLERIRSEMIVVNNTKGIFDKEESAQAQQATAQQDFASTDPNLGFASRAIAASEAPKQQAGFLGDMSNIIAQGKLIHAVLETAIDTTLPGQLRAVVSRDIYAEQSRNILLPKGSRLIGVYNTNILRGQDRVFILWTRIIRPDGVDIYVNSPGVDNLGRAGLEGFLDQKFKEVFSGAILTSVIGIGAAAAADALNGGGNVQTTVNTDGSATSAGDPVSFATLNAVGNIGNVGRTVVDGLLDLRPTITVDQGTKINVFVNRDLYFPPNLAGRTVVP